jgi:hypothetical protein
MKHRFLLLLAAAGLLPFIANAADPGRTTMPSGTTNLYADSERGSDNANCRSDTPCKSLQGALTYVLNKVEFDDRIRVVIHLACQEFTEPVHFAAHSFFGAEGGGAVTVKGCGPGRTILRASGKPAAAFYFVRGLTIQDMSMRSDINCLSVSYKASIYISNIEFLDCGVSDINFDNGGSIIVAWREIEGVRLGYSKAGQSDHHIIAQGAGSSFSTVGAPLTIAADIEFKSFITANTLAEVNFRRSEIIMGSHKAKGRRFDLSHNAVILSGKGGEGSEDFFPGDQEGRISKGGIYD